MLIDCIDIFLFACLSDLMNNYSTVPVSATMHEHLMSLHLVLALPSVYIHLPLSASGILPLGFSPLPRRSWLTNYVADGDRRRVCSLIHPRRERMKVKGVEAAVNEREIDLTS